MNCSGYHSVQICNRHNSRAAQFDFNALHCATLVRIIDRLTLGHDARSPQLCAKPLPVEHVLGIIAFRLRFGGVLRGRFVPRTCFDRVPAGTVLAEPPPPPHSVLFRVRICLFPPFESTPYLRTDTISEPPFCGLFLPWRPPKSKTLLNIPPIFYFITPFVNFSGVQRERERKTTPFFKRNLRVKSQIPPFVTILGPDFVARKVPIYRIFWEHACGPSDPEWGVGREHDYLDPVQTTRNGVYREVLSGTVPRTSVNAGVS